MGQPTVKTTDSGMQAAISMFGQKYGEFTTLGTGVNNSVTSLLAVFQVP